VPKIPSGIRKLADPVTRGIVNILIRTQRRGSLAIFASHGLHTPSMCNGMHPPPSSKGIEEFEGVLSAIKRHFTIVSMDEAAEMLSGRAPVRTACAVLTFDDSLKCMAQVAAPLLASMNLTATFFISTETIETQEPYWWLRLDYALSHAQTKHSEINLSTGQHLFLDSENPASTRSLKRALRSLPKPEREQVTSEVESLAGASLSHGNKEYPFAAPLTWDGVRELLHLGMSLGSHTVSHANLLAVSEPELGQELKASKYLIEEKSGSRCRYFCYPYGLHSDIVSKAVSSCGYDAAVTTMSPGWNRPGDDIFSLRRSYLPRDSKKVSYLLCSPA
jgi:peptidoglycan/xylan/chitin deacetylase (PgdA/CDA1 family)